ncbi:hypothetical protein RGR602_PB00454 (plasmid) [Rhizobium gallicum bv. gallicum R602sp]|uniref:Uncharacterized protein n=1 Tax=Rhizobium gallicum bv. gallicum R602sp TaxID=1041138 RepID=A0A0B4XBL1_9HYPH|nr:hypothetical protein RGR602_PB00454 [Rhizobium gallicum bv. gallicum R602sp]
MVQIGEAEHDSMFDILPPLSIRGSMFAMREFLTGSVKSVFFALRLDGRIRRFHGHCDLSDSDATRSKRETLPPLTAEEDSAPGICGKARPAVEEHPEPRLDETACHMMMVACCVAFAIPMVHPGSSPIACRSGPANNRTRAPDRRIRSLIWWTALPCPEPAPRSLLPYCLHDGYA